MNNTCLNTPEGTRDRLFSECRERRSAQSKITGLFKRRGYSEVTTPEVEYYDLLLRSGHPLPQESMIKIIDRSGKILVMRPDCTAPIARLASTKLSGGVFPQRLYYNQTIFRSGAAHMGSENEIAQCGIELIGAAGIKGDLEAIAMAIDTLDACGLKDYQLEIGHFGFLSSITDELHLDEETKEQMYQLIESKSFAGLGELIDSMGDFSESKILRQIPLLFGDVSILDEAEKLTKAHGAIEALNYLKELYSYLKKAGRGDVIRFDLGLVNRMDYYTGVVFKGYVPGAARDVLAGGRYDKLLGCYGKDRPATGFAVYVDDLASCLTPVSKPPVETVIHFEIDDLDNAIKLLDSFPSSTAELSMADTEESSIEYAKIKGAKRIVLIKNGETREVAL